MGGSGSVVSDGSKQGHRVLVVASAGLLLRTDGAMQRCQSRWDGSTLLFPPSRNRLRRPPIMTRRRSSKQQQATASGRSQAGALGREGAGRRRQIVSPPDPAQVWCLSPDRRLRAGSPMTAEGTAAGPAPLALVRWRGAGAAGGREPAWLRRWWKGLLA